MKKFKIIVNKYQNDRKTVIDRCEYIVYADTKEEAKDLAKKRSGILFQRFIRSYEWDTHSANWVSAKNSKKSSV